MMWGPGVSTLTAPDPGSYSKNSTVQHRLAHFICKEKDSEYLRLCKPQSLHVSFLKSAITAQKHTETLRHE